ncbi:MAG TPA: hypothetical protein PKA19_05260 [Bacillota bacterium]|nr:hypothetical protein [Bacillota bacterium]
MTENLIENGLRHRGALLREIRDNGEPVFPGDLAVDGNDLKELGIAEGYRIGRILKILLDIVHRFPEKNEKDALLKIAAEITAEGGTANAVESAAPEDDTETASAKHQFPRPN